MIPNIPVEKSVSFPNMNHLTLISNNSNNDKPSSSILDKTGRIIIVGDSGVGKSCIIMQYVQGMFKEKGPCTAGVELSMKAISVDGDDMKLQIWDTAGQERYRTVTKSFYKQAMGAILVFDLTSKHSFEGLGQWYKSLEENAPLGISMVLMGNKCDLVKERTVQHDEIIDFIKDKNLPYFETSAKTKKNLQEAFLHISKQIKKQWIDNKSNELDRQSMRLMSASGEPGSPEIRLRQQQTDNDNNNIVRPSSSRSCC